MCIPLDGENCHLCNKVKVIPLMACEQSKNAADSTVTVEELKADPVALDNMADQVSCIAEFIIAMERDTCAYLDRDAPAGCKVPCYKCKLELKSLYGTDTPPLIVKLQSGGIAMMT